MGTLKPGDKTGPAVKVVKLLAQSTGDFTREELKKDVKFAWTDKTKAEIAAAKGGNTQSNSGSQNGGTQNGGTSGGDNGGTTGGGTTGGDNGGNSGGGDNGGGGNNGGGNDVN
jgi:hypothetical protein